MQAYDISSHKNATGLKTEIVTFDSVRNKAVFSFCVPLRQERSSKCYALKC